MGASSLNSYLFIVSGIYLPVNITICDISEDTKWLLFACVSCCGHLYSLLCLCTWHTTVLDIRFLYWTPKMIDKRKKKEKKVFKDFKYTSKTYLFKHLLCVASCSIWAPEWFFKSCLLLRRVCFYLLTGQTHNFHLQYFLQTQWKHPAIQPS